MRLALLLLVPVLAASTATSCAPETVGDMSFLDRSWVAYKQRYLHADGYVRDPMRGGGDVTSEGQGYALLRAAWMNDRGAFERVFTWTERRLRRPDGLYSWHWTPAAGGRLLDANTAGDADQEIAFALLLASRAFNRADYGARARELLIAIRAHTALPVSDGWFPAAGNWAVTERIVNLSYFLPYAYPYFDRVDPEGNWPGVLKAGYALIGRIRAQPGVKLVPDFMTVDAAGAVATLPPTASVSAEFTSDAMRLYWRVAVDCELHRNGLGCPDPLDASFVSDLLARDERLFTRYALDGTPRERTESISFYACVLPFLRLHAPAAAQALRRERLTTAVLDEVVSEADRYYDANWVWFGLAAVDGLIARRTRDLWPEIN